MAGQSFCKASGMQMNELLFELLGKRAFCIIHERDGVSEKQSVCICVNVYEAADVTLSNTHWVIGVYSVHALCKHLHCVTHTLYSHA